MQCTLVITLICGLQGFTIFFKYYLIKGKISKKKLLNIKCVFRYSLQILPETFLILKRNERDTNINVYCLHVKYRYSSQILAKHEFSREIFYRSSSIKFRENPCIGNHVVPCERTDGHT
jgi:hypothetical protein